MCCVLVMEHNTYHRNITAYLEEQFAQKYARLLLAMSTDQAKSILGFPPHSNPSSAEIAKAYKQKVVQNHPDLGGSHDKMVDINVAKDVLDGKQRPTYNRAPPAHAEPPQRRPPPPPSEDVVVKKGQDFAAAMADSGVQATVEWKFISVPESAWEKSFYPSEQVWVLYGETPQYHWFLALKYRAESSGTIPTELGTKTKVMSDWQSSLIEVPKSVSLAKTAIKSLKSVGTAWNDGPEFKGPKKFVVWPGGKPTEQLIKRIPKSGGVSLKDILVGANLVSDDAVSEARKTIVEVYTKFSKERRERMQHLKPKLHAYDSYDFFVRVNGHEYKLSDDTIENLVKRGFSLYIYGDKFTEVPKQLNKLRGGGFKAGPKEAMELLLHALEGEPDSLRSSLTKAVKEWEDKTASFREFRASMTLQEVSDMYHISLLDSFKSLL